MQPSNGVDSEATVHAKTQIQKTALMLAQMQLAADEASLHYDRSVSFVGQ